MVKGGLGPHMSNFMEDGTLNLCILFLVLMHMLIGFGIHLYLLVNSCLIELEQLKC
jgi:hypothetical protein